MNNEERMLLTERFFYPKSIAVIGVSSNEKAFTTLYLLALIKFGYKGKLYPVNPKGGSVFGLTMYPSVNDIPDNVDLAIVSVPGKAVPAALEECLAKGIRAAIVLSSGFGEAGDAGKKLQEEINRVTAKGIRIVGPNCFGIYCPGGGITIKPGDNFPRESGPVALVTQSGLFTEMIVLQSRGMGIRFSKVISYGNAADLNESDYLEMLEDDPETKVIACYIEGVKNGRRFFETVRRVSRKKPVLIWKAGLTKTGSSAAASHTASLAGSEAIWDTFIKQSGAIRIDSIEELIDNMTAFLNLKDKAGKRVAFVSGSGGNAVTGADACDRMGLELPAFPPELQEKIRSYLPPVVAGLRNPFDLADPFPSAEVLTLVLEAIAASGLVETIIVGRIFMSVKGPGLVFGTLPVPEEGRERIREVLVSIRDKFGLPVVAVLGEELNDEDKIAFESDRRALRSFYISRGIPVYPTIERAAGAIANVVRYKEQFRETPETPETPTYDESREPTHVTDNLVAPSKLLTEIESKGLLAGAGIAVVETRLATSREEAVEMAGKMGFPVAMKIVSAEITHKSDVGGVKLGLGTPQEVSKAYDEIMASVKAHHPDAPIDGVAVQRMADAGTEVIIGMTRDAQFGPVLMFGLGGILVELLKDVAFRIVPLDDEDAGNMIREIKGFGLLDGYRGRPAADIGALEGMIIKLSRFVESHPQITELDINPVIVYENGAVAVDARIVIEEP